MERWNWKGLDVINAHERSPEVYVEGMRIGIKLVSKGKLKIKPLITNNHKHIPARTNKQGIRRHRCESKRAYKSSNNTIKNLIKKAPAIYLVSPSKYPFYWISGLLCRLKISNS